MQTSKSEAKPSPTCFIQHNSPLHPEFPSINSLPCLKKGLDQISYSMYPYSCRIPHMLVFILISFSQHRMRFFMP